jgi:transitional endoplasmic reticulum ATPase
MQDFVDVTKEMEPSAMREVFVEVPDVKWEDIGGLADIKQELREAVEWPLKYERAFAIAPVRGGGLGGGDSHVTERLISQLLTELDGLEILTNVIVIAATNRPDIIDPALLRPGRFDRLLYVSPPDRDSRIQIMKIHTRKNHSLRMLLLNN